MSLMLFISIVILIVAFTVVLLAVSELSQETIPKDMGLLKAEIIMLWVVFIISLIVLIWELHIAIGVIQSSKYLENNSPSYEEMDGNLYG